MATAIDDQKKLADLYDEDFHAWAGCQAEALRRLQATHPSLPLDFEHLIEEVADLAKRDVKAAKSQLRRLIVQLLQLEHSPADHPRRQWLNTVDDARQELDDILSPSVVAIVSPLLPQLYIWSRRAARRDLLDADGVEAADALPVACPYTVDQLIDEAWYPANRHGLVDREP